MSIRDAYDAWSETYDTDLNKTRALDEEVTRSVLAGARYTSILEIGCGTGKNTTLLATLADTVHALDFSPSMLAKARARPGLENVTFALADLAQRWPCTDASADLVVCNLVLEHIESLGFIFGEAARALVDHGRLFICELHPFRQYQGTQANFNADGATTQIAAFVHHISDFLTAARRNGFVLQDLGEWWHTEDGDKPPRLASFLFARSARSEPS